MSCPELRLHAHGRKRSEPPPRRRGYGLGIIAAWLTSFGGHAAVTAWILLTVPFAEPTVDRGVSFGVEIVVESAPPGSEASSPAPTTASAPHQITTSITTPETASPVEPASVSETVDAPDEFAPRVEPVRPVTVASQPRRSHRTPSAVSVQDLPPAVAPSPQSPADATDSESPAPATETALMSAPAVSGAHLKTEDAFPRAGNRSPEYPAYAQRRGIEGRVILMVEVRADGTPANVAVVESSSHESLDTAAVVAVRTWTFHPGRRDGAPVESWVRVPITFRLVDR